MVSTVLILLCNPNLAGLTLSTVNWSLRLSLLWPRRMTFHSSTQTLPNWRPSTRLAKAVSARALTWCSRASHTSHPAFSTNQISGQGKILKCSCSQHFLTFENRTNSSQDFGGGHGIQIERGIQDHSVFFYQKSKKSGLVFSVITCVEILTSFSFQYTCHFDSLEFDKA